MLNTSCLFVSIRASNIQHIESGRVRDSESLRAAAENCDSILQNQSPKISSAGLSTGISPIA